LYFAFDRAQGFLEAIDPSAVPAFIGGGQLALQALMALGQLGVAHGASLAIGLCGELLAGRPKFSRRDAARPAPADKGALRLQNESPIR